MKKSEKKEEATDLKTSVDGIAPVDGIAEQTEPAEPTDQTEPDSTVEGADLPAEQTEPAEPATSSEWIAKAIEQIGTAQDSILSGNKVRAASSQHTRSLVMISRELSEIKRRLAKYVKG